MNTLDDLRDTFDLEAGTPDGHGVVEAAQARAGQIRRRRRALGAAVAAGLVALAAVAVPLTTARLRAAEQVATPPPYRVLHELTLTIQGLGKWWALQHGTDSAKQFLIVRNKETGARNFGGTISAYDPGAYDSAALERGEKLEVGGHRAYLTGQSATAVPQLGWRDGSGVWITIMGPKDRAGLIELAGIVRLGPPRPVTGPVQFGRLPGGLPLQYAAIADETPGQADWGLYARLGFAAAGHTPDSEGRLDLTVTAEPVTNEGWKEIGVQPVLGGTDKKRTPQWETIGGQKAWYLADGPGAHLWIETPTCGVTITVPDLGKISYAELVATVAAMTFSSCTDVSTWRPVVR